MGQMTAAQQAGRTAEARALGLLVRAGLELIERNWTCPSGELDLIMRDGATLVFVEVRQRRHGSHGQAADSIDKRKQMRIIRAARHYLQTLAPSLPPCRFDVVSIDGSATRGRLRWRRAAFDAGSH